MIMEPLVEHKIEIDGIPLNYTETGKGSQVLQSQILVHFYHLRQMDHSKFRLICCDPPGYGKSRPHHRDFAWDAYLHTDAKIYLKLLDLLAISKVSLVGWSSGGMTAQLMAIRDPDRIHKLIFWHSYAIADSTYILFSQVFRSNKLYAPEDREVMLKEYGEVYWQELLDRWSMETEVTYKFMEGKSFMNLTAIKCPTLIFQGQRDGIVREDQAQLCQAAIKNSKLILIPTGRHDLHLTHTDQFLPAVQSFLLEENLQD